MSINYCKICLKYTIPHEHTMEQKLKTWYCPTCKNYLFKEEYHHWFIKYNGIICVKCLNEGRDHTIKYIK